MAGKDKLSSLVWLCIAIFICIGSLKLSLGTFSHPGPGFLSFSAGLVMAILSVVVYVQERKISLSNQREEGQPILINKQRGWKVVWTIFALLVYAVLMNYLGFLLSTFLFLAFLLKVIEPQRWPVALGGSLVASLAFYFIFEMGLKSQLPKGLFWFF
jgi:putative tricarboxylic transport membrane protein